MQSPYLTSETNTTFFSGEIIHIYIKMVRKVPNQLRNLITSPGIFFFELA